MGEKEHSQQFAANHIARELPEMSPCRAQSPYHGHFAFPPSWTAEPIWQPVNAEANLQHKLFTALYLDAPNRHLISIPKTLSSLWKKPRRETCESPLMRSTCPRGNLQRCDARRDRVTVNMSQLEILDYVQNVADLLR